MTEWTIEHPEERRRILDVVTRAEDATRDLRTLIECGGAS